MAARHNRLLTMGWAIAFVIAVSSFAFLLQGVLRDTRWGEPSIPVDFSQSSDWQSAEFRVWGRDTFRLLISSVSHDPELSGRYLTADFRVQILGANGQPVMDRVYRGEHLDHRVPEGYTDTVLATLDITGQPWETGTLRVRVGIPDPVFRTTRSHLKLWSVRPDAGMGGLLNYAAILPGTVALALALIFAAILARRGRWWPLLATGLLLAASAALPAI